jgi:hypothetical protein
VIHRPAALCLASLLASLPAHAQDRDAQAELATYGAVYGLSLGIWSSFELDLKPRPGAWLSLATTGGALYGGLKLAETLELSPAQVRMTGSGAGWLTLDLMLLSAEFDLWGENTIWLAFATAALAGGALLTAASQGLDPSEGDLSLVNSGGLWMIPAGLLFGFTFDLGSGEHLPRDVLLLNLVGLGTGLGLASAFDPSREQVLYLDLGLLAGGLAGGLFGTMVGVGLDTEELITGLTLLGMASGAWIALVQVGFEGGQDATTVEKSAKSTKPLRFSLPLWAGTW